MSPQTDLFSSTDNQNDSAPVTHKDAVASLLSGRGGVLPEKILPKELDVLTLSNGLQVVDAARCTNENLPAQLGLYDIYFTTSLWWLINPTEVEKSYGQDLKGRIWDVLNMFSLAKWVAARHGNKEHPRLYYRCIFLKAHDRKGARVSVERMYAHKTEILMAHLDLIDCGGDTGVVIGLGTENF